MDLYDAAVRERLRARLGEVFTDRLVICGIGPLAGMTHLVTLLEQSGSRRPLLVSTGDGAGPLPTDAEIVRIEVPAFESMTEELREQDRQARELPPAAQAAIDEYDPQNEAVWFAGPFVVNEPIRGRQVLGGRPRSWLELEDKLVSEQVWSAVGYPAAPSEVVDTELAQLEGASSRLDSGHGVVWSGDARDGFNGGGDFVRWVTDHAEQRSAYDFFSTRCDRVRVMPFLEGVPCSIHGMVFPDGVAAFRPVELAILRDPSTRAFVYGGQGTFWDPPDPDRAEMRDLVRSTGEHLRTLVDYRGAFGIDGILTDHGFRPTEINTRMSGGINQLTRGLDYALFTLLHVNLVAGRDPGVGAGDLEAWAVPAMDADRIGRPLAISDRRTVEEPVAIPVSWDGTRLARWHAGVTTSATGAPDAVGKDHDVVGRDHDAVGRDHDNGLNIVEVAPIAVGMFAKIDPCSALRRGDRVAALNIALMRFLDEQLGTGFGAVEAAPDVRRAAPADVRQAAPADVRQAARPDVLPAARPDVRRASAAATD